MRAAWVFVIATVLIVGFCASDVAAMELEDDIVTALDDESELSGAAEDASLSMDEASAFEQFISIHKKKYESKEEYTKRFRVWKDNLEYVRKWNAAGAKFELGMNEFGDLTDAEWSKTYLNPNFHREYLESETFMAAEEERTKRVQKSSESLVEITDGGKAKWGTAGYDIRWHKNTGKQPQNMDWLHKGATTAVNNQAKCFACYAFAACGAIEGAKYINTGQKHKLSAQQIVDCSSDTKFKNHGCKGGTMVKSYKYIIKNGLMKSDDYGYNTLLNSTPECKTTSSQCKFNAAQVQQKIVGYVNIRKGDETDLKNAVGLRPVSVAIDAHHRAFKLYRSGIFSLSSCTTHLTHGVLMVGYGERDGKKFWKLKNSWGTTWGQQGYGELIRGENMCSIADWSNYPIINSSDKVSTVMSLSELGDNTPYKTATLRESIGKTHKQ